MFKFLSVFLITGLCGASFIRAPHKLDRNSLRDLTSNEVWAKWEPHVMDFVNLIDVNQLLNSAIPYFNDDEFISILTFLFSPDLKQFIFELETQKEFKEVVTYLTSKGYDVESLIDAINSNLGLKPFIDELKTKSGKGINGFIEDLIAALPIEEFKRLFFEKVETVPEIKDLLETLTDDEFVGIMKNLSKNKKVVELKSKLEGMGLDFVRLCKLAREILGDNFQACDEVKIASIVSCLYGEETEVTADAGASERVASDHTYDAPSRLAHAPPMSRDMSLNITSCQDLNIRKRIRRSEAVLHQAAECVSRGHTFQKVSEQFNIPISTIRFFMARKGILPERRRGRCPPPRTQDCASPEPPFHMQHYKLPLMLALQDDPDDCR